MATLEPTDFPLEIRTILGTKAGAHDSTSRQDVCAADARITPQIYDATLPGHVAPSTQGQPETTTPWRIRNAHRGEVLLCPGGPSGLVGGMLAALTPPQDYSHCGMVMDDGTSIRHCTTSDDQIQLHPVGTIAGIDVPAPLYGFEENALRFGWPGTLTQSVEDALRYARSEEPAGKSISDPSAPASSDNKFWIHALSFYPSMASTTDSSGTVHWRVVWPTIVKPCTSERSDDHEREIVDALDRVAKAAEGLRGHYRTYAYTDAVPRSGPPMLTDGPLDSDSKVPAVGSTCTGAGGARVATTGTLGYMCSSFIWSAVQEANKVRPAGTKRILLDGRPDGLEPGDACDSTSDIARQPYLANRFDPATVDGLYFYPESIRIQAAAAFYKKLLEKVIAGISQKLPAWLVLGGVESSLSVPQLLAAVGAGLQLSQLAGMIGITPAVLESLLLVVINAPENVANQVGNSFALDDATLAAASNGSWRTSPGIGRTVSPDDILHNWAPPSRIASDDIAQSTLLGLYGRNIRVVVDPPMARRIPVPPVTWQISQGFGLVRGRVFYRSGIVDQNGQPEKVPLPGARIRIGGTLLLSNAQGTFAVEQVAAGRYWMDAEFEDQATGLAYTYPGDVVVVPLGGALIRDIELNPPPASSREVFVVMKADLLHRALLPWNDPWRQHPVVMPTPARMGLEFFPDSPEFHNDYVNATNATFPWSFNIDDACIVDVVLDAHLEPDSTLTVKCRSRMRDAGTAFDTDHTPFDESTRSIPARSQTLKEVGMDLLGQFAADFRVQSDRTGGVLPSHATVSVQVWNLRG